MLSEKIKIIKDQSLKKFNTFNIDVKASLFFELTSKEELVTIFKNDINNFLVIGEGSNLLFTKDIDYLVIKNSILGRETLFENNDFIDIKISSGENWNNIVIDYSLLGYAGIENLVKIPGNIGAAVVQNIGAYGVEIKDVVQNVEVYDTKAKKFKIFFLKDLKFAYRDSVFKKDKNRYIVVSVTIRLLRGQKIFNIDYKGIKEKLGKNITPYKIAEVISSIRDSKLPSPEILGNAGSFFKNPIVENNLFLSIQKKYKDIPFYKLENNKIKIPAAWLIETSGFKGIQKGKVGVYENHALILVNHSGKNDDTKLIGMEIYNLSQEIIDKIKEQFSIKLEREVLVL